LATIHYGIIAKKKAGALFNMGHQARSPEHPRISRVTKSSFHLSNGFLLMYGICTDQLQVLQYLHPQ
jgi:hypothetical protein